MLLFAALILPVCAARPLQNWENTFTAKVSSWMENPESLMGMQLFQLKVAKAGSVNVAAPNVKQTVINWWDDSPEQSVDTCMTMQLLLPIIGYLLLGFPLADYYFRKFSSSSDPGNAAVKSALCMSVFAVFMENMTYSILFVDSVDFASSISWGSMNSGTMVGIQKVGTALGTFLIFLLFLRKPDCWRTVGPHVYLLGFVVQVFSSLTFAMLGLAHVFYGLGGNLTIIAVNMARLLGGFGGGLQISFGLQQSAHLVTGAARSLQNTRWYLGGCLGMGFGPLLASSASSVAQMIKCPDSTPSFEVTIALAAFLPLLQLPAFSKMRTVEDETDVGVTGYGVTSNWFRQTVVVLICLIMQVLRAMSMAAVEAAATELLRTHYGWSRRTTGVATSLVIFSMLPCQVVYEYFFAHRRSDSSIRGLLMCAIAGSAFLAGETLASLLVGAVLLLPTMALSSGLIMGRMQAHSLPDGSLLDLNKITLFALLLSDLIGRGFGPSLARESVEAGGQAAFARDQLVITGISLILNEIASYVLIPEAEFADIRACSDTVVAKLAATTKSAEKEGSPAQEVDDTKVK